MESPYAASYVSGIVTCTFSEMWPIIGEIFGIGRPGYLSLMLSTETYSERVLRDSAFKTGITPLESDNTTCAVLRGHLSTSWALVR